MNMQTLQTLGRRTSGASLGAVRVGFGLVMLYEALWYLGLTPNAARNPSVVEAMFTGDAIRR